MKTEIPTIVAIEEPTTPVAPRPDSRPAPAHEPPACAFCGGHAEVSEALAAPAEGPLLCDGCVDLALEGLLARRGATWT